MFAWWEITGLVLFILFYCACAAFANWADDARRKDAQEEQR